MAAAEDEALRDVGVGGAEGEGSVGELCGRIGEEAKRPSLRERERSREIDIDLIGERVTDKVRDILVFFLRFV